MRSYTFNIRAFLWLVYVLTLILKLNSLIPKMKILLYILVTVHSTANEMVMYVEEEMGGGEGGGGEGSGRGGGDEGACGGKRTRSGRGRE